MNDLTRFLAAHGGPVLFAVVLADQAGLPLPAAPWLVAAGAFSASGKMNGAVAIGMSVMGSLVADSLWFCAGRLGAARLLRLFSRLALAPVVSIGTTRVIFGRHGFPGLVLAKFLPGLGMVMPALAGALGLGVAKFLLYDSLGSLLYGTFYFSAGFLFHNQLQEFMAVLNEMGSSSLLLGLVLVPAYLAFKYVRRRQLCTRRARQNTLMGETTGRPVKEGA
jgi:membrane protein DedA with SNARE-associated domain